MTITGRDRRALIILGIAAVISLMVFLWPSEEAPEVVGGTETAEGSEQRLARVRELAAQLPSRQAELDRLNGELGEWEAGMIQPETGQQAQAEIVQVLRRVASQQVPPLQFSSVEMGQVRALGKSENYAEALVSVSFDCTIEQLVNLLADLTAQPESVVSDEIRINPLEQKKKTLRVRLTVAGLLPHRLVPERKGLGAL